MKSAGHSILLLDESNKLAGSVWLAGVTVALLMYVNCCHGLPMRVARDIDSDHGHAGTVHPIQFCHPLGPIIKSVLIRGVVGSIGTTPFRMGESQNDGMGLNARSGTLSRYLMHMSCSTVCPFIRGSLAMQWY
jgi:hypothetical protein